MKKLVTIIMVGALAFTLVAACAGTADYSADLTAASPSDSPEGRTLTIASTIFPQYDWVRQILGSRADDMNLVQIIDSAVDLHSFQPSVSDIASISTADLFIYVGGESDSWVENVVRQAVNPNIVTINLMDVLGDMAIAAAHDHDHDCDDEDCDHEHHGHSHGHSHSHSHDHDCDDEDCDHEHHGHSHGHSHSHSHDHDCDDEDCDHEHHHGHSHSHSHDHDHDCDDEDCTHYHHHEHSHSHSHHHDHDHHHHHHHDKDDEHVWLSLRNAALFVKAITNALIELDPDYADYYLSNMTAYVEQLSILDDEFSRVVAEAARSTILVADRFPFIYLVSDYNISHYAAFSGCHAEAEASFSTIIFLAGKVDELALNYVIVTESGNPAIAESVIVNSESRDRGVGILQLDSMQLATSRDRQDGATFLSIMQENLEVLRQALS